MSEKNPFCDKRWHDSPFEGCKSKEYEGLKTPLTEEQKTRHLAKAAEVRAKRKVLQGVLETENEGQKTLTNV